MIAPNVTAGTPRVAARTLTTLVEQLREVEARHQEDVVAPLADLIMSDEGALVVPGRGEHVMNDWSRSQFATLLGLRWDRWFAEASPAERAADINRRLQRARGDVRVRTGQTSIGPVVRAVVSPSYEAIPDSSIAASLVRVLGDLPVQRAVLSEMTTCFVVEVGEPLRQGGIVGTLHGGILVRNSDVGFASLAVLANLTRLICSNGMVAPVPDGEILRVRHTHIDIGRIEARMVAGVARLPDGLRRAGEIVSWSTHRPVENVAVEIHDVLRRAGLVRRHERAVLAAFAREPHASAFGVSQAITLAAQDFSPEQRVELEAVAGEYLARATR